MNTAAGLIPLAYAGTLILDNQNGQAFLGTTSPGGASIEPLLQWDPGGTGVYDAAMVGKAYSYYSTTPGYYNNAHITISGAILSSHNANWMLYVVSP